MGSGVKAVPTICLGLRGLTASIGSLSCSRSPLSALGVILTIKTFEEGDIVCPLDVCPRAVSGIYLRRLGPAAFAARFFVVARAVAVAAFVARFFVVTRAFG